MRLALALVVAAFASNAATADERSELRAKQAALYEQMLAAPTEAAPMVEYARVSVELGDFDAAIATLERALIFEPNEPLTRFELGVAYFRIGSYGVAEYQITEALKGGLPGELTDQAELYLAEIAARTDTSRFSGVAAFGLTAASNANNGPRNEIISFFGVPALLAPGSTAQGDVGVRASIAARHVYDLGRANNDSFITDFSAQSIHYFSETGGDVDVAYLTLGPSLALDDKAYGPKIRPYARVGHARAGNDSLFTDFGLGATVSAPVTDMLTSFGEIGLTRREFHNGFDAFDSVIVAAEVGATARVAPRMSISGSVFGAAEFTDGGAFDNQEVGLRYSVAYSYDPRLDWAEGLWTLKGHVRVTERFYDDPVAAIDPARKRNEEEFRFGLSHLFRIQDGFGVRLDGDYLTRDANIPNFDLDNLSGAISVVYEF